MMRHYQRLRRPLTPLEYQQIALADPDQPRHRFLHAQVLHLVPLQTRAIVVIRSLPSQSMAFDKVLHHPSMAAATSS